MTSDSRRVLEALRGAKRPASGVLPLRRIALEALGGDTDRAARILADLDSEGYIRTDTMGWLTGRLTAKASDSEA